MLGLPWYCCVDTRAKRVDIWEEAFWKKNAFFEHLVVCSLDLGQISFNLVENAFATRHLAFLVTGMAFYDILTWACAEIKILRF